MKLTDLLQRVVPFIGAAATGNVPALIALAAKEVSAAVGKPVEATPEAVGEAVANATPEQLVQLREREMAFKERMQEMGFKNVEELRRLDVEETKTFVGDTQHARNAHASDRGVYWLGIAVLVTFAGVMGGSLYGAYKILTGGLHITDVGVVAAVFGFLGTVVGYVAANAQQVVSYFFGSSRGSNDKSREMADAIKRLGA